MSTGKKKYEANNDGGNKKVSGLPAESIFITKSPSYLLISAKKKEKTKTKNFFLGIDQ